MHIRAVCGGTGRVDVRLARKTQSARKKW
jgi:hypothetical protein